MKNFDPSMAWIIRKGIRMSLTSVCIASIVFSLLEIISWIISLGIDSSFWITGPSLVIIGLLLSPVLSVIGGVPLSVLLYAENKMGRLSKKTAIITSLLLGAFLGFGLCQYYWYLIRGRGDYDLFILHMVEVVLIGSITAMWVGIKIEKLIRSSRE